MTDSLDVSPALAERIARIEQGLRLDGPPAPEGPRQTTLAARMSFHVVPAVSIAVIDDGRLAWSRAYGRREAGRPDPATPHTLFQAGSISKAVTALAALRLVAQGGLALDEDVQMFLTSWRVPANAGWQPRITLRQLLSHTAGLTVHGFPGYRRDGAIPTLHQVLNGEPPANTGPVYVDMVPGTQFRYAGGGTLVVQQMLTDVTGRPFAALLRELVFDPLGMADSTFEQPLPPPRWEAAATGHYWVPDNPVIGQWHVYPEQAAAGLWTTPSDLARFALALQQAYAGQSGALLPPDLTVQMLTPEIDNVGLGMFLDGTGATARFGHDGDDHGFVASLKAYKTRGQGAVIMTNSYSGGNLIEELWPALAREYAWPDYLPPDPVPAPLDAPPAEAYVGEYELAPGKIWAVTRDGDTLALRPPDQAAIPLSPESATRFFARAVAATVEFVPATADQPVELIFQEPGWEARARRRR